MKVIGFWLLQLNVHCNKSRDLHCVDLGSGSGSGTSSVVNSFVFSKGFVYNSANNVKVAPN